MALAAFVDLRHSPIPKRDEETDYEYYRRDQFAFGSFQGDIEIALSSIMHTEEEFRSGRRFGIDS
jgi:hypothetical protein